jgi:hypothetical protein
VGAQRFCDTFTLPARLQAFLKVGSPKSHLLFTLLVQFPGDKLDLLGFRG